MGEGTKLRPRVLRQPRLDWLSMVFLVLAFGLSACGVLAILAVLFWFVIFGWRIVERWTQ